MEKTDIVALLWLRSEMALERIREEYGRLAGTLAGNILRCAADAEECVSDALAAVWDRIPPERPDPFLPYFLRIVRNLALNRRRAQTAKKRGGELLPLEEDVLGELVSFDDCDADKDTIRGVLNGFLDTLPPRDRTLFLRRYWFEDPVPDIASRLGITENHARVKLTRMKAKLREMLEKEGISV